jgi:hypothetical protein
MAPLTIVGSAQGRTQIVRNSQRIRSGAFSSRAIPMPNRSSNPVETIVKYAVRSTADQNSPCETANV